MKTRKPIRASLAVLFFGLAACEGGAWPTSPAASGVDARARLPAPESIPLVDVSPSMGSSHPVSDPPLAGAYDATESASAVAATEPATVYVPVYVPLYVPTGAGNVGAVVPATPVSTPVAPPLVAPVGAAPIGTGGTLGQYGTPGAFSSTGITAGDPGTLRGTFP